MKTIYLYIENENKKGIDKRKNNMKTGEYLLSFAVSIEHNNEIYVPDV